MKINYFQDYQTRLERSKRVARTRRENRKLLRAFLIAAFVTPLFLGLLYQFATHAIAQTPLEGQILTIEGLAPLATTTVPQTTIKTVVADCTGSCVEAKILEYFPRSGKTMVAIAKAESGLKMSAINYNCWYDKNGNISDVYIKNGGKACKKEDRAHSFGVDCFVLQAHYPGRKTCPDITIEQHLKEMAELSRVQGLRAWVAYNRGLHLEYLD